MFVSKYKIHYKLLDIFVTPFSNIPLNVNFTLQYESKLIAFTYKK